MQRLAITRHNEKKDNSMPIISSLTYATYLKRFLFEFFSLLCNFQRMKSKRKCQLCFPQLIQS
ncbi:hypothetical protein PHSC3_001059 [Chlamydiales bacterium STE3]|nr:hypothetical protein PHSC3_001059 [Chlamydiales bacterium STE3]